MLTYCRKQLKSGRFFLLLLALFPLFLAGNRPFPMYLFGTLVSLHGLFLLPNMIESRFLLQHKTFRIGILIAASLLGYLLLSAIFIAPALIFPLTKWFFYLSCFLVFVQALYLAQQKAFPYRFLRMFALMGVIYSIYGIVTLHLGDKVLFYEKTSYQDELTSVFINRNHFALYASLSLTALIYLIGITAFHYRLFQEKSFSRTLKILFSEKSSELWLYITGAFIILAAILMTGSRGVILQLSVALSVMAVIACVTYRKDIIKGKVILFLSLFVFLAGSGYMAFHHNVSSRLHYIDESFDERVAVWQTTVKMIEDKPLFGYGVDMFEQNFNHYRDYTVPLRKRWNKAHNDYLEVIAKFGIVYFLAFIGFIAWMLKHIIQRTTYGHRFFAVHLTCCAMMINFGIHEIYDFGGQMPAILFLIVTLIAICFSRALIPSLKETSTSHGLP
ncbi:MAG: O-antigen ligase family protein [Pseudomonadota bacterium]